MDPRLLRQARRSRVPVALLALIGVGQAAATLAIVVALTRLVVGFVAGHRSGGVLALLVGGYVARAGLSWAEQVIVQWTAARVAQELRHAILVAALRRGPAWLADFGPGRLTALLTAGLDALRPWFSGYLPALLLAGMLPPVVLVTMALADPGSALIAVLTLPLVPLFGALIGLATQRRAEQQWQAGARLAGHFLDVVKGLATLRVFGRAERQVAVVERMTEKHRAATVRVLRLAFLSSTALDLLATLSVGLIAVEAGLRVAAGDLGLRPALLVILLAPEVYRPLREVGVRFHASADAAAVIAELDQVLTDVPSEPRFGTGCFGHQAGQGGMVGVVGLGLRVRHPGRLQDALQLPTISVSSGEFVALQGSSGAGKTTALRVLAGLQPFLAGTVEWTGPRPLYLPQQPTLPQVRTVAGALLLDRELSDGRLDGGHCDGGELFETLDMVGLATEVAELPRGLDTPLGERGQGLSSGQRQRLALARLLRAARERPTMLLLDEPTAHLDAEAELAVIRELRAAAARGCAVLVVGHHPALLAAADRRVEVRQPPASVPASILAPSSIAAPPSVRSTRRPELKSPAEPENRTVRVVRTLGRRPEVAVLLGAASWVAGVTLTGAAGWLLVRASSLPPVLTLSVAVVTVRASAVARPLLRYLERLVSHQVAFVRLGVWRAEVYADLIPRVPGAALRRRGELLTRVVEDVDARVDGLLRGRLPAASAALVLALAVVAATVLLPAAGLVLAAGLLISAWSAPTLAARWALRLDATTALARAELANAVTETIDGLEELASRGTGAALAVADQRSDRLATLEARAARTAGAAIGLAQLGLGWAVTATALVAASAVSPELAAVLLLGVVALAEPVLALPEAAIARRRAAGASERLAAMADQPPSVRDLSPSNPSRPLGSGSAELTIRGLVAGWDPARPPALRGLDLDLPAGARIAVLGPSGSGKSTLAAVLVRLLDPHAGTIQWDDVDVRTLTASAVRARVGLVSDGLDHVFASTVRENLRLARPGASDGELRAVLARVRLGDWLAGLPEGLDTWLGEGGGTISGGERRRLVTARALLADPSLLILDEPTEGLDQPTALALMADLLAATAGRTVLLLTHRIEGLDQVDAVHELAAGRLRAVQAVQAVQSAEVAGAALYSTRV